MCYDTRVKQPSLSLSILGTLAYSGIFHYPLDSNELKQRLIGLYPDLNAIQLEKELSRLVQVDKKGEWYFLRGQDQAVELREKRAYFSQIKYTEVKTLVKILKRFPMITSAYITGSVAMGNAVSVADDIDVLIVTRPQTLWLTRLFVVCWTSLIGKYRLHGSNGEYGWCFNLWLDQHHLQIPKNTRSVYSAYEVVQAKQVLGTENELLASNRWINEYINYPIDEAKTEYYEMRKKDERGNPIFKVIEEFAYFIQRLYMRPKRTRERVGRGYAFFHPRKTDEIILTQWQKILEKSGVEKKDVQELVAFFEKGLHDS